MYFEVPSEPLHSKKFQKTLILVFKRKTLRPDIQDCSIQWILEYCELRPPRLLSRQMRPSTGLASESHPRTSILLLSKISNSARVLTINRGLSSFVTKGGKFSVGNNRNNLLPQQQHSSYCYFSPETDVSICFQTQSLCSGWSKEQKCVVERSHFSEKKGLIL